MFYYCTIKGIQTVFSDIHKVVLAPYMIESLPGMPKTGQNLLVTGKLRTKQFIQDNGKKGTSIQILAKQIYLCNDRENNAIQTISPNDDNVDGDVPELLSSGATTKIKNQNEVELLAQICFDIQNEEAHSTFSLALHHFAK